ncbi:hypothetical protein [Mycobacterium sp. E2327]|uniref:hypothetical protein n=1 Tax=Mycobacterium sp. E2327 TaxID=1834132 RepID=UPI000B26DCB2|nr:hypothetical protein [Mycobacterium sp. E2327]
MQIAAVFDRADFDGALEAARKIGPESDLTGLSAPLDGGLWGKISTAWDRVESALKEAFQFGIDFAREKVSAAIDAADELIRDAGNRARDVHEALLTRLQAYLSHMYDSALSRVATTITVGQQTLALSQVELSQKLSMTGSLKMNITEIAGMTGAGEVTVLARYGSG